MLAVGVSGCSLLPSQQKEAALESRPRLETTPTDTGKRPPTPQKSSLPVEESDTLHVTQAELAIWRKRARTGPYRVQGDRSRHSPGDWQRIVAHTEAFMADPSAGRWPGPVDNNVGGCVLRDGGQAEDLGYQPPVKEASQLRDAAFYAMIENSPTHAQAVKRELIEQARIDGVQFTDRTRWCLDKIGDGSPGFMIANWLTKLLFAIDYLDVHDPSLFSTSEKELLNIWLRGAAEWMMHDTDTALDELFIDRRVGNYDLTEVATNAEQLDTVAYYGGPVVRALHRHYNNRRAAQARFVTLTGLHLGDDAYVEHGKRFVKEALMFTYFPDGSLGEFERWEKNVPNRGWTYAVLITGSMLTIADHLARAGDTELYEFETSQGALGTAGGPKSLESLVEDVLAYADGTYSRFGTDSPRRVGSKKRLIDVEDRLNDWAYVHDTMLIQSNVYFRNEYISSVYTRKAPGAPPYPPNPRHGSGDPEGGEWGIYPGMLFMFGAMEGEIWPYPN